MGLFDISETGGGGEGRSSFSWMIVFSIAYFILISIYVAFFTTPDDIADSFKYERSSNSLFFSGSDQYAWNISTNESGELVQNLTSSLAKRVMKGKDIVPGENDKKVFGEMWKTSSTNLILFGSLVDYRIHAVSTLIPLFLVFLGAIIVDGAMMRKINSYKNSFSSPMKHYVGGQVLGVNATIIAILLLFLPLAVPLYVFVLLFSVKLVGWWIWVMYLPKRI